MSKVTHSGSQGPSPRRSRQEQKADTRLRVRDAARALFLAKGFDATSTKEVAERAGVAAGTVFVHAPDKADLLCLVMHDLLRGALEEAFRTMPQAAPLGDRVHHVFAHVLAMYGRHEPLAKPFIGVTLSAGTGPNALAVQSLTFELLGRLAAVITEAQGRGEVGADVPALLLAQNFFALYVFALMSWTTGYAPLEAITNTMLRMSIDLQVRGTK
jgi:TetR/AcrR family transcriptional regulator, cholesterol catabolism regulator